MSEVVAAARLAQPEVVAFRVLVVDDDPDMAAFLARMLEREGMEAHVVADGAAALAAADFEQLRQLGHRMRGVGNSYGFERVSSLGKEIEEGAKSGDKDSLATHIAAYGDYLSKLQIAYE